MDLAFEFRQYKAAFASPLGTAHGDWLHREGVIIRISDETGRTAFGEVAPIPWFGTETVEDAVRLCTSLGSSIGPDVVSHIPGTLPCCRFAFGSALESLSGNMLKTGSRSSARLLPAGHGALEVAAAAVSKGFVCLKWKVGILDSKSERSVFEELVSLVPAGTKLRLDANGAWDLATAREWATASVGTPVEFIEQPLPAGEDAALATLGAQYPGLFALDESVTPPGALRAWLDRDWPGVVVIKPSLSGDPSELRSLLADSRADVVYSTAMETIVGWEAALGFALGDARNNRALGFGVGRTLADTQLAPPGCLPMLSRDSLSASHASIWNRLSH